MQDYDEFPLTIAIVDAMDNLSIQVHPDDKTANEIENGRKGKRESWYFLSPPDDGWIIGGCSANTRSELEEKIREGRVEDIVKNVRVKAGDYVFSPPGTLHAITKGCFAYEIEEGDNLTYRLYDYGRVDENGQFRELQIEKGLASLDLNKEIVLSRYDGKCEVIEQTYATRKLQNIEEYENEGSNLECVTITTGESAVQGIMIKTGMSVILEPGDRLNCGIQECIVARSVI
jgi:mannose-6-phosphate isomerase class I